MKDAREEQKLDYLLILDFEATCTKDRKIDPQEIIEFPCLKLNAKTLKIESVFHQYVRPTENPVKPAMAPCTAFCPNCIQ